MATWPAGARFYHLHYEHDASTSAQIDYFATLSGPKLGTVEIEFAEEKSFESSMTANGWHLLVFDNNRELVSQYYEYDPNPGDVVVVSFFYYPPRPNTGRLLVNYRQPHKIERQFGFPPVQELETTLKALEASGYYHVSTEDNHVGRDGCRIYRYSKKQTN